MTLWHYIAGYILLIAALGAILLMIVSSIKLVIDDAVREAQQEAKLEARILAERKYQEMIATTRYRVRIGLRIVDETSTDWSGANDYPA